MKKLIYAVLLGGLILLGFACGKSSDMASAGQPEMMRQAQKLDESKPMRGEGLADAQPAVNQRVAKALANRKIVRTGVITFETESHDTILARVKTTVAANEGFLFASDADLAQSGRKRGTYVFKLPVDRFEKLVEDLSSIPGILTVKAGAEDVTMQWNDLEGRLKSAEDIRRSLIGILQTRAGDMEAVLKVEREIHRVTDTIETIKGQLRALDEMTTLSTLTVVIQEPQAMDSIEPGILQRTGNALVTAVNILVDVFLGLVVSLGVLLPLGGLAWIIVIIIRRIRKKHANK